MNKIETRLTLVTGPTSEPVTLEDARRHLRVDIDDDDPLIENAIAAAREYAEAHTRRQLMSATWALRMDYLPCEIVLPLPPLQSVSSITYVDSAGDPQTLSSSLYTVDLYSTPGKIVPAYNSSWPTVRGHTNDVVVTFVAGYASAALIPARVKQAILMLVGHYYENREAVVMEAGFTSIQVPMAVISLLDSASWGFYA